MKSVLQTVFISVISHKTETLDKILQEKFSKEVNKILRNMISNVKLPNSVSSFGYKKERCCDLLSALIDNVSFSQDTTVM